MDTNTFSIDPDRKGILATGSSGHSQLGRSVVNLSSIPLTQGQIDALEKGLTFCPTPRSINLVQLWDDLDKFSRRLRLKKHFDGLPTEEDLYQGKFRNPSSWSPAEGVARRKPWPIHKKCQDWTLNPWPEHTIPLQPVKKAVWWPNRVMSKQWHYD